MSGRGDLIPPPPGWPAPLGDEALHGLLGELVRRMSEGTECDPAALWLHTVVGVGNMIGHGPYLMVDGGRAHLNMFGATVGETSRARKGTAWRRVRPALLDIAGTGWLPPGGGLSSAEGLVEHLTDEDPAARRAGEPAPGRAWFAVEPEMSTVWKRARFDGSTLLEALREFYDSGDYAVHRRNGASVTGAHFSLVAHDPGGAAQGRRDRQPLQRRRKPLPLVRRPARAEPSAGAPCC